MRTLLLFQVLFNLSGILTQEIETTGPLKCKNPTGKLWSSKYNRNCGKAVCAKRGGKAKWMTCPRSATEDNIEELKDTMKKTAEDLKQIIKSDTSLVLSALMQAGEVVKELCRGPVPVPACTCGIEGSKRIMGGQDVPRGKYPWIAALKYWGDGEKSLGGCGATLIASRWAITAAHCMHSPTHPPLSIVLGQHNITDSGDLDKNRKDVIVEAAIAHPNYQNNPFRGYDVALLRLAEEVDLNVHTPACLPESGKDFTGQMGTVYGWGTSVDACNPGLHPTLKELNIGIVSNAACRNASGNYTFYDKKAGVCRNGSGGFGDIITNDMLCAGCGCKEGACYGDSGGPLSVKEDGQHYLVGVVSWGLTCLEDSNFPGVYVKVANPNITSWIHDTIAQFEPASYCSESTKPTTEAVP